MLKLFKRTSSKQSNGSNVNDTNAAWANQPKSIAVYHPCGGDVSMLALSLAKMDYAAKGSKGIITEFPCMGIPRLSYAAFENKYEKEKTIDQILIDYERDSLRSLDDYVVKTNEVDLIPIYEKSRPDLPTLLKLNKNQTLLDVPQLINHRLKEHYQRVWFILQGQLISPMTLMTLQQADCIVLTFNDVSELIWTLSMHKRLIDDYRIDPNRVIWNSTIKAHGFIEVNVLRDLSELLLRIDSIEPLNRNDFVPLKGEDKDLNKEESRHVGMVNPIDYLEYHSENLHISAELSTSDNQQLESLMKLTREYLRDHYSDEYIKALIDREARAKVCYYIADFIKEHAELRFNMDINKVISIVQREITEMGVLQPLLDDDTISSIEINSPFEVIAEENGFPVHKKEIRFQDTDHIYRTIDKMLMPMGKTLTANDPIVDSNYRGFRINIMLDISRGGVSAKYPIISIRKFPPDVYSNEDCIKYGNLSQEIVDFCRDIIPTGGNIAVGGGTNSGKTTTLLRLPLFMDKLDRIITVEDSEEMLLKEKIAFKHYPNIASLIVKWHELKERRQDLAKLIKATLRQNPDVIVVGEVRDPDAAEQSMTAANTGHQVLLSIHADSDDQVPSRLVELLGDTKTAARRVGRVLDLVFFQEWVDGVRVVTAISELMGFEGDNVPIMNRIFSYNFETREFQKVGKLIKLVPKMKKVYRNNPEVIARWCEL
ncbi:ATPase, T2SS/T4P/T4SS family [Paenibacillus agricola]|uniref:CpaF family protein n=1 Tax=Paenibacillus agricola TaxID=2716264 RepID=A0ABX0JEL5_9BACL|nr:ATPase, T2SS/T4P/T4SS family [Paenibacillus agricola]NHN34889.1 CpaF family protein [Paenibacillus agricola]